MNQEHLDYLTTQFVWPVQNEADWYLETRDALREGDVASFIRTSLRWLRKVVRVNYRPNDYEKAICVCILWHQADGDMERFHYVVRNLTQFPAYYCSALETLGLVGKSAAPQSEPQVATHNDPVAANNEVESETIKEQAMNSAPAFVTKSYVFGVDVDTMSEGQLIDSIKKIEAEIADLNTVKTKSKKVASKIEELEAMLAKVVEVLDGK